MSVKSKIDQIGKEIAADVLHHSMHYNDEEELVKSVLDTLITHGIITSEIKTAYLKHL